MPADNISPLREEESEGGSDLSGSEGGSDEDAAELGMQTAPPEFYDPEADDRDERWMSKLRAGRRSDALLSCPLCFTTVCVECQQHELYENQFRAMFVMNCRIDDKQLVKVGGAASKERRRKRGRRQDQDEAAQAPPQQAQQQEGREAEEAEERYNPVYCAACETEIGLRELPPSGVYHFFNVVASTA